MKTIVNAAIASLALLTAGGLAGCAGKMQTAAIPTLDIEAAIDNPRAFDLTEIAESIEFIPLDDSQKEGLVGGNIFGIDESERGFYIRDNWNGPVKMFDRQGKFLSTRGYTGRGPNEITAIQDVAVDPKTDMMYALSSSRVLIAWDAGGRMTSRNDSVAGTNVILSGGKLILLKQRYGLLNSDNDAPTGTKSVLLEIYSTDLNREGTVETVDRGAPRRYNEGNVMLYNGGVISDNGSSPVVKEILCDTVFHLEGGTLRPEYILDPGRYTIPAEAFGESPSVPWSDDFHLFTSLMEGEKYLIVQTQNGRPVRSGFLVVDKSESAGGFSATGPEGKPGLFIGGVAFKPMYVQDNRLVGYMQALDIVDGAAAIINPDLAALAATLKEDSNPVLVVATLKK